MKKILFVTIAIIALVAVSCSDYKVSDTASVTFGRLEAKSTVAGEVRDTAEIYWKYKATKQDSGITQGQTDGFVALNGSNKGLGSGVTGFAPGKWAFELQGYYESAFTNLIYECAAVEADLVAGQTTPVTFSATIADGSKGRLKTIKPDTVLGSSAYTVTCSGVYQGTGEVSNITPATDGTITEDIKQGLWKLTYTFTDTATSAALGTTDVTALIMNGALTTVTVSYNESTGGFSATVNTPEISDWTKDPSVPPFEVGDVITMGTYPSTYTNSSGSSVSAGDYAGKDIAWKVLEVDSESNKALVISEKILTNFMEESSRWESGSDYVWLNNVGEEGFVAQYGLQDIKISSPPTKTSKGGDSQGNVFLLSKEEVESIWATDADRVALDLSETAKPWYTRSIKTVNNGRGDFSSFIVYRYSVSTSGSFVTITGYAGLRPAFWFNY